MNYLEKINKVREHLQEWQKEHGKEFSYHLMGIGIGEDPIDDWTYLVTAEEEKEIIKYLERRGFLKIVKDNKTSLSIKILPKKDPVIKLKTLELISRELKDHYTGYEITKLLEGCGADKRLIIASSKWLIFYGLFEELAIAQDDKATELLFNIIGESVHPLNLSGNQELSANLVKQFNDYLKYDNLAIFYSDKEQKYTISSTENLIEVDEETLTQDFNLVEEILPDINKSAFSEKVLELVAKEIEAHLSSGEIQRIITPLLEKNKHLKEEPAIKGYIDDWLEEQKWLFSFEKVLQTIRKKDAEADRHIEEIIETLLHPLNHNADESKTEEIADKLSKYLKYDKFYIQNTGNDYSIFNEKEMDEMHSSSPEFQEQERQNKKDDEEKIKQSKETIKELRDTHQAYIDILEIFCGDPKKPTKELNDAYIFLSNKIEKNIKDMGMKTYPYQIFFYKPFKNNLYSAESEWNNITDGARIGRRLSWDGIRPALYKVHGEIVKLLNMAEEDTEMTDEEKKLEGITKLISEKRTKAIVPQNVPQTMKIEISKMPDLNVRSIENNVVVKNNKKRVTLPKFPRTEWSKVSITFMGERDILLSDGKNTKPSTFEGLGCEDGRNGRPNDNWKFLLRLAMDNGQTPPLSKKEREKNKKQKQKITDILRKIFDNDTDPFEKEAGGIYKAKFNIKYTNNEKPAKSGKYSDLEEVFSEMTEPSQEDVE